MLLSLLRKLPFSIFLSNFTHCLSEFSCGRPTLLIVITILFIIVTFRSFRLFFLRSVKLWDTPCVHFFAYLQSRVFKKEVNDRVLACIFPAVLFYPVVWLWSSAFVPLIPLCNKKLMFNILYGKCLWQCLDCRPYLSRHRYRLPSTDFCLKRWSREDSSPWHCNWSAHFVTCS